MTKLEEFYHAWREALGVHAPVGGIPNHELDKVVAIGVAMERDRLKKVGEEALKKLPAAARLMYRKDIQKVRDILDGKQVAL